MKKVITIAILILFAAAMAAAFADEPIGRVAGGDIRYIEVPVYHDTTMRTDADFSARERHFLTTVPATGGLRDAVKEMLLAGVVHVPEGCGNYRPGDSVHYWSIYQAWTGPAKARVPLIRGPRGERGYQGPPGIPGPPGQVAAAPTVIVNNYTFGSLATPSYQLGGNQPPIVTSTGLISATWWPGINISTTATARGGNASSSATAPTTNAVAVNNTVTNTVSQQQQQQQNQSVAIDP